MAAMGVPEWGAAGWIVEMRSKMWHANGLIRLAFIVTLLGSCVRVAPYERETLSRRDMENGRDADLRTGEEHAQAYREGSSGGGAVSSGGCGCN